jgi:hypothetical protein
LKIELKLRPFIVPSFVIIEMPTGKRDEGLVNLPSMAITEVTAEALDAMCDAFRKGVFEKACKADPKLNQTQDEDLLGNYRGTREGTI